MLINSVLFDFEKKTLLFGIPTIPYFVIVF